MNRFLKLLIRSGLGAISILKLRDSLCKDSRLTQNYLVLTLSSCAIATLGLVIDSSAVIIGAMIIAPLILPIRGFAFAALEGDRELLRMSAIAIAAGTMLAIACSWVVGQTINLPEFGSEILSRTQPTLIDLSIAIVAGGVSGYAKIRPAIGDAIPGTAIAVALMPPICVVGLALSQGEWHAAQGAGLLYLTNLIGINLACLAVYVLSGYAKSDEFSRTLSWSLSGVLIAMLTVPLGISFWKLTNQAEVDSAVRSLLTRRSVVKREDVRILHSRIDWQSDPPSIWIRVRAVQPITAEEVAAVERQLQSDLNRPFKVFFDVTTFNVVGSTAADSQ